MLHFLFRHQWYLQHVPVRYFQLEAGIAGIGFSQTRNKYWQWSFIVRSHLAPHIILNPWSTLRIGCKSTSLFWGARHSLVEMKHPTELKDCSCCKAVEARMPCHAMRWWRSWCGMIAWCSTDAEASRMASKPSTDAVSTLTLMADLEEAKLGSTQLTLWPCRPCVWRDAKSDANDSQVLKANEESLPSALLNVFGAVMALNVSSSFTHLH